MSVRSRDVQAAALLFVWNFHQKHGFPPTVREIGEAVGYSSPSSAAKIVDGMVARGWLASIPHRPRAICVTDTGREAIGLG